MVSNLQTASKNQDLKIGALVSKFDGFIWLGWKFEDLEAYLSISIMPSVGHAVKFF